MKLTFHKCIGYYEIVKTYRFNKLIKIEKKYIEPNFKSIKKFLSEYIKEEIKDLKFNSIVTI